MTSSQEPVAGGQLREVFYRKALGFWRVEGAKVRRFFITEGFSAGGKLLVLVSLGFRVEMACAQVERDFAGQVFAL